MGGCSALLAPTDSARDKSRGVLQVLIRSSELTEGKLGGGGTLQWSEVLLSTPHRGRACAVARAVVESLYSD